MFVLTLTGLNWTKEYCNPIFARTSFNEIRRDSPRLKASLKILVRPPEKQQTANTTYAPRRPPIYICRTSCNVKSHFTYLSQQGSVCMFHSLTLCLLQFGLSIDTTIKAKQSLQILFTFLVTSHPHVLF